MPKLGRPESNNTAVPQSKATNMESTFLHLKSGSQVRKATPITGQQDKSKDRTRVIPRVVQI